MSETIPKAAVEAVVEEMRTMAIVAGQASVETLDLDHAAADAKFAEYCTRWADQLDVSLLASVSVSPQEPGLSLTIQRDPLAISALLDDSNREREMYHRLVYDIRQALGEDGIHAQLLDLPKLIAENLASSVSPPDDLGDFTPSLIDRRRSADNHRAIYSAIERLKSEVGGEDNYGAAEREIHNALALGSEAVDLIPRLLRKIATREEHIQQLIEERASAVSPPAPTWRPIESASLVRRLRLSCTRRDSPKRERNPMACREWNEMLRREYPMGTPTGGYDMCAPCEAAELFVPPPSSPSPAETGEK